MIVLAESNFVLELALQQEHSDEAQYVLALAEARHIELIIPACCFAEPYQTLTRRERERKALNRGLECALEQLGRSKFFSRWHSASLDLSAALKEGNRAASSGLEQTVAILTRVCSVCPKQELARLRDSAD